MNLKIIRRLVIKAIVFMIIFQVSHLAVRAETQIGEERGRSTVQFWPGFEGGVTTRITYIGATQVSGAPAVPHIFRGYTANIGNTWDFYARVSEVMVDERGGTGVTYADAGLGQHTNGIWSNLRPRSNDNSWSLPESQFWRVSANVGWTGNERTVWRLANDSAGRWVNFETRLLVDHHIHYGNGTREVVMSAAGVELWRGSGNLNSGLNQEIIIGHATSRAPNVTAVPELVKQLDDTVDWTEGITATWGITTTRPLVNDNQNGQIRRLPASQESQQSEQLTTNGETFNQLGAQTYTYELRDGHSLDRNKLYDTTMATVNRRVSVKTELPSVVRFEYASGARTLAGTSIPAGTIYNEENPDSWAGRESKWTNQPLIAVTTRGTIPMASARVHAHVESVSNSLTNVSTGGTTARSSSYHVETDENGIEITGYHTQRNTFGNRLTRTGSATAFIDRTPPEKVSVEYHGGFHFTDESEDSLSGLSEVHKTQIALVAPSESEVAPTAGWKEYDNLQDTESGHYDVWVRAMDKAGNIATNKTHSNLHVGGQVSIALNAGRRANVHAPTCTNHAGMTITDTCKDECAIGDGSQLGESSQITYQLTLTNEATIGSAEGTYEMYLPAGMVPRRDSEGNVSVTVTPSNNGESATIEVIQEESGRYRVTGTYANIRPGGNYIRLSIACISPAYDIGEGATNIISTQANITWKIGTGAAQIEGSATSNYANHEIVRVGVVTTFTKVGADDITTGLEGTEFALYRWVGESTPKPEELRELVNVKVETDGNWRRVKKHGDPATVADVFTTASDPIGEVELGILPTGFYTLIETKAPEGYALPLGQWNLIIDTSKTNEGVGHYQIEFTGKSNNIMPPAAVRESNGTEHTYKIINARPFSIGMSGLGGTREILLAGFVLMALAGNAYLVFGYKQTNKG
jgi:hypothetical protein